VNFVIE
jgi:ribosomal protein S15P/S13E